MPARRVPTSALPGRSLRALARVSARVCAPISAHTFARTSTAMFFAMLALLWTTACAGGADSVAGSGGGGGGSTGGAPARLDLSTSAVSLGAIGASEQINATVRNASGAAISGASVNWSSADITVADVAGAGTTAVITARAPGRTTIRAQIAGFVQDIAVQVLAVRGLSVTPVTGSLRAGDQITLVAALDADQGTVPDVRWASDNPGVATVSSSGVVTGVGPGSAVVRATAVADARISASALLTIMPARSVRIVGAPAMLWMGDEATLNSSVDVDSTQSRDVVWSSSQPTVASISDAGVVTAITTGTTTLRLTSAIDPRLQDSVRLEVRPARTVTVTPASATLGAGETRTLSARVVIEAGLSTAVTWRSDNPAIAMVAQNGMVTGVSQGSTTITAVSVADTTRRGSAMIDIVPVVRDLDLTPSAVSMFLEDTRQLTATVSADAGASRAVIWRSSNGAVASVSETGLVTANTVGTAIITAIAEADTTRRATSLVTVRYAPVVTVSPSSVFLTIGQTRQATVTVKADAGVSTAVTWQSANTAVATVSPAGLISAVGFGNTTITATSVADTSRSATITVEVTPTVRGVTITPAALTVAPGESRPLVGAVTGDPGVSATLIWRSSNASIASVSATGIVTGGTQGSATITALAAADTTKRATAAVTVRNAPLVTITPASASLTLGEQRTFSASVSAESGQSTAVTWRSGDATIVTVSPTGVVTAVGFGTTTVTAVAVADTTRQASVAVTVAPAIQSVSVTPSTATIGVGQTVQLTPAVVTQGSLSAAVSYRSSNPSVASVNFAGLVTGLGTGNATITVLSTVDTTKRATAAITISASPPPPTQLVTSWSSTRLGGALHEDVVALDAVDASTIFAVNSLGNVYRYNGSTWSLSATGASYNTRFVAVAATSGSHAIAVGTNGVIVRFNGSSWSTMSSGTAQTLYGVYLENSSVGFVVGANGTALRYNGSSWSTTSTGTSEALSGVWSTGGVAFAVGTSGTVLRYSGSSWSAQSSGTTETLYSVAGTSANDVVVVGTFGTVLRYNGSQWTRVSTGSLIADLFGVAGSSANGGRMVIASDDGALALNGSTLSTLSTPYAPRLFAVAMDGSGNVVVGGQRGVVMRTPSTSWETLNAAPDLIDAWTTGSTNSWAVGEFGFIYRWNGSTWSRQTTPTTSTLNTVWGSSASDAFAGGDHGTMLRWNGSSWSAMSFPSSGSVYGIWGSSASNVFAVTSTGQVLRYNGSGWSVVATASGALWSVFGSSASDVYVSGENGVVMRFNGTSWSSMNTPASGTIAGIWAGSASNLVAVGASSAGTTGLAYSSSGSSWSSVSTGTSRVLTSVWGQSAGDLYVTGEAGTILRFNGTSWSSMSSGTTDLLWAVTGSPSGTGGAFAVGYNSTLVTGTGSGSLLAAARSQGTISLEPAPGARTARGALPTGKQRQARKR
ncbi:Ig-like domain-containing protein [Gemmatimonas aurantiaca]|uniref:Ig-like domain-containing protein n=1 Tax=Gemmatimonas aurantiaca TaxID=173480 RepID=UPI00301DCAF2